MISLRALRALGAHCLLTLRLNLRSKQAMVYGYLVPVFFLVAFGSLFRADSPLLFFRMGQLLTITILGGACFGLPTALVAERERGVWRRYRLLPQGLASLVASTLIARFLIVASALALQIGLARLFYGTPLPEHPLSTILATLAVTASFLGLGLLIAALANDVPAVQALGQCLFLPMIMIGGVGVPLDALPVWAQRFAGFMPGRYAVSVIQNAYSEPQGLAGSGFNILALAVIGGAAGLVGAKLFRWETGRRVTRGALAWAVVALAAWVAVGGAAAATGRLEPALPPGATYREITDADITAITYDQLPGDNELVTRLSPPFAQPPAPGRLADIAAKLRDWPPAKVDDEGQAVRNLLSVAAVADINADLLEAPIARAVFDEITRRFPREVQRKALAWVVLYPDSGDVVVKLPEFGQKREPQEFAVRERTAMYAKKFLGRLEGAIQDR
ncbi:hypothetical protein DB347_21015 [Opitutaceae bacterium EW11]|nr:hypothetical protein DB347_21015 [Opitutaceae bacterium EW11]